MEKVAVTFQIFIFSVIASFAYGNSVMDYQMLKCERTVGELRVLVVPIDFENSYDGAFFSGIDQEVWDLQVHPSNPNSPTLIWERLSYGALQYRFEFPKSVNFETPLFVGKEFTSLPPEKHDLYHLALEVTKKLEERGENFGEAHTLLFVANATVLGSIGGAEFGCFNISDRYYFRLANTSTYSLGKPAFDSNVSTVLAHELGHTLGIQHDSGVEFSEGHFELIQGLKKSLVAEGTLQRDYLSIPQMLELGFLESSVVKPLPEIGKEESDSSKIYHLKVYDKFEIDPIFEADSVLAYTFEFEGRTYYIQCRDKEKMPVFLRGSHEEFIIFEEWDLSPFDTVLSESIRVGSYLPGNKSDTYLEIVVNADAERRLDRYFYDAAIRGLGPSRPLAKEHWLGFPFKKVSLYTSSDAPFVIEKLKNTEEQTGCRFSMKSGI